MNRFLLIAALMSVIAIVFGAHAHHEHRHGNGHHHDPQYSKGNCSTAPAKECDPDNHDLHCHDPDDPSIHLCIGESIALPQCRQMTCIHYDGDVILVRSCHDLQEKPGCTIKEGNVNAKYPFCCPTQVCED